MHPIRLALALLTCICISVNAAYALTFKRVWRASTACIILPCIFIENKCGITKWDRETIRINTISWWYGV